MSPVEPRLCCGHVFGAFGVTLRQLKQSHRQRMRTADMCSSILKDTRGASGRPRHVRLTQTQESLILFRCMRIHTKELPTAACHVVFGHFRIEGHQGNSDFASDTPGLALEPDGHEDRCRVSEQTVHWKKFVPLARGMSGTDFDRRVLVKLMIQALGTPGPQLPVGLSSTMETRSSHAPHLSRSHAHQRSTR